MNHLPAELVVRILSLVQTDEPWFLPDLRLVCRAWDDVVEDSPGFWANVVSNVWRVPLQLPGAIKKHHALLGLYCDALKRSAPYPLSVALDLTRYVVLEDKQSLLLTLVPHSQRLVSLSIVLSVSPESAADFYQLLGGDLSCLETLTVMSPTLPAVHPRDAGLIAYQTLPPSALPRLRTLRIAAVFFGVYLARPSLKHLNVYAPSGDWDMRLCHWSLVICILQHCRFLETLEVSEALPLAPYPYEHHRWSNGEKYPMLRSCTIKDTPERVARLATLLHAAPVPTDAYLDVTLTPPASDIVGNILHPRLYSLAFQRFVPEEVGRVEIDSTLRVYVGDAKRFEFALAPDLNAQLGRGRLSFADLLTASVIGPEGPRTKMEDLQHGIFSTNIEELCIRLPEDMSVLWWGTLFALFRRLRRLEARVRDIRPLFDHLHRLPRSKRTHGAVEELVLLGVRVAEGDHNRLADSVVAAFSSRKSTGRWVPRRCVLRYRGRQLPVFEERLKTGLKDIVEDLIVYSS